MTAHPTQQRIIQLGRSLVMDLRDAGCMARCLICDRDAKWRDA
ncbi:hypothetical protein [Microtetraspora malaysiensis]